MGQDSQDWEPGGRGRLGLDHDGAVEGEEVGGYFPGSVQFSAVAQLCLTLQDPMDCSMSGLPVHYQLPESTQRHLH